MMLIVRLYPETSREKVWDFVVNKFKGYESAGCTPLYASQREDAEHVSVIFEANKVDDMAQFLVDEISECPEIRKTRTITLMKPVFFPVPKNRPKKLCRYRVAMRLSPSHYRDVYNKLLHKDYHEDLYPTYMAFSFGEDDILLSMLAPSTGEIKEYAEEHIKPLDGVRSVDISLITKSCRLMPHEEWKKYRRRRYLVPPTEKHDEEFDWTLSELAALSGAFPEEL